MTHTDLNQMDAYLRDELSAAERSQVEARLSSDQRFAREFEQHRVLREVLVQYGHATQTVGAIHASLLKEGFYDEVDREHAPPARKRFKRLLIIFLVVLAAVFSALMLFVYLLIAR